VAASSRNPINWEPRLIRSFIKGYTKHSTKYKGIVEEENSTSKKVMSRKKGTYIFQKGS
jgi:hypothetical protein